MREFKPTTLCLTILSFFLYKILSCHACLGLPLPPSLSLLKRDIIWAYKIKNPKTPVIFYAHAYLDPIHFCMTPSRHVLIIFQAFSDFWFYRPISERPHFAFLNFRKKYFAKNFQKFLILIIWYIDRKKMLEPAHIYFCISFIPIHLIVILWIFN